MKMKPAFFLRYTKQSSKKNRLRKLTVTLVCAAAVAFTALSSGFMKEISYMQEEYIKNVSELEMILVNQTNPLADAYSERGEVFTDEEVEALERLEGTESVVPFLTFGLLNAGYSYADVLEDRTMMEEFRRQTVSVKTASQPLVEEKEMTYMGPFSYSTEAVMDAKSVAIDSKVENGAYLNMAFARGCDLLPEDLEDISVTVDMWVPVGIINTLHIGQIGVPGEDAEEVTFRGNKYVCKKTKVTVPVRGILAMDPFRIEAEIYLPADVMLAAQKEMDDKMETANAVLEKDLSLIGDAPSDDIWVQNPPYVLPWSPCLYYIVAKDIASFSRVKGDIQRISPNFTVISQFQDIEAGTEMLSNTRSVMIYVSLAILAVVFLLMALIYVYLIDRRKFEFAVLRANGLTKREVRKVVCTEMFFQFAAIFLLSLICAAIIYFVMVKGFGYPFTYDGMTVVYALLISLGAVVLPTIISLAFVNRFEPDTVMRN